MPANALLFRGDGTRVAVVDAQSKVHLQPVAIGRNSARPSRSSTACTGKERLVLNPSDSLADGDAVAIAPAADDRAARDKAAPASGRTTP